MYAAAGGLSLARRQDRRNVRKQHLTQEGVHQNLQKRFNQLQHLHAPASTADQYVQHHNVLALKAAGLDPSSRLPSYVDLNRRITGFGSTDILEGKAATAWLEKEKRGTSYSSDEPRPRHHSDPHRKWTRRNRIQDSSYGGSSSDEDDLPGTLPSHQSSAANMLLYVGLGTVAIGLVIGFVGTGEKGFKTLELRLIGPTLICSGFLCCLIRILLCLCPSRCFRHCLFRSSKQKKLQRAGDGERTIGLALNRHAFPPDKQTDYYKYLPFAIINQRNPDHFILLQDSKTLISEKRSLIKPSTSQDRPTNSSSACCRDSSKSSAIPHINILNASSSDNVVDEVKRSTFEDDPHSLNSSYENLIIKNCSSSLESAQNVSTLLLATNKEQDKVKLARLKSTLTFSPDDEEEEGRGFGEGGLACDYFRRSNLSGSCEDCDHLLGSDGGGRYDEPIHRHYDRPVVDVRWPPTPTPSSPPVHLPSILPVNPSSPPPAPSSFLLTQEEFASNEGTAATSTGPECSSFNSAPRPEQSSIRINSSQKTVCFNVSNEKSTNELVLSPDSLQTKPET